MPGPLLGTEDTAVNKGDKINLKIPDLLELTFE